MTNTAFSARTFVSLTATTGIVTIADGAVAGAGAVIVLRGYREGTRAPLEAADEVRIAYRDGDIIQLRYLTLTQPPMIATV